MKKTIMRGSLRGGDDAVVHGLIPMIITTGKNVPPECARERNHGDDGDENIVVVVVGQSEEEQFGWYEEEDGEEKRLGFAGEERGRGEEWRWR